MKTPKEIAAALAAIGTDDVIVLATIHQLNAHPDDDPSAVLVGAIAVLSARAGAAMDAAIHAVERHGSPMVSLRLVECPKCGERSVEK